MKKDIHPAYVDTTVTCNSCGTSWDTRSTVDEITVEICSNCHPFFTGKQKIMDVAGRVDRFKSQQAAAAARQSSTKKQPKAASKTTAKAVKLTKEDLVKKFEQTAPAQTDEG